MGPVKANPACWVFEIRLADVRDDVVLQCCPFCGASVGQHMTTQLSGPLEGFRQCQKCETWFSPNVKWEYED